MKTSKMKMEMTVIGSFALALTLPVAAQTTEILAQPGANLSDIQRKARESTRPVVVTLAGGAYSLTETLRFGAADSDVTWRAKPGERPVITGARRITGWKAVGGNVWEAEVPEAKEGRWRFRRLFVNGVEKERARHPNKGHFVVKRGNIIPDPARKDRPNEPSQMRDRFHVEPGEFDAAWTDLDEGEFVMYACWRDTHHPIASFDGATRLLVLGTPLNYGQFWDWGRGYPFHFENLPGIMDVPGEWCLLSKRGVVRYLAAEGEDPNREEIAAPFVEQLLALEADPAAGGDWVRGLVFKGIAFEKSNFWLPREDCSDMQAADRTGCGVLLKGARDCRFEDCSFHDFGAYCVDVLGGSRDNAFVCCAFTRAGSGGLRIDGGKHADHPFSQTGGTRIEACDVGNWGVEFPSACGIIVKNAANNVIRACEIHDGPYTGVSLGWNWCYSNSVARCNLVEANHIHHINVDHLMSDLGGIYTLGVSPGTILRGNRIHDIYRRYYNGNGIYLDESSAHIVVENNVIWDAQDSCVHIHFGKELTIRNNILAQTRRLDSNGALSRGFVEPHVSMFFSGNIVQRLEGAAYGSHAPKKWNASEPYTFHNNGRARPIKRTDNMLVDYNYFAAPGETPSQTFFGGYTLADWQAGGRDVHSLIGASPFVDPKHGDFTLKPDSPARKIFDTRDVPFKPFAR